MAQQGAGLTVTSQGRKPQTEERGVTGEELRRLDRLAPLLHELLDWGLVHPTASGAFELREDVQERLRQLTASRPLLEAQVYVGRPCRRCGQVAVTRLVDGVRMCTPCRERATTAADPVDDAAVTSPSGERGHKTRRARKAG
jgi:hypothetical protein